MAVDSFESLEEYAVPMAEPGPALDKEAKEGKQPPVVQQSDARACGIMVQLISHAGAYDRHTRQRPERTGTP